MHNILRCVRYGILLLATFHSISSFAGSVYCTGKLTDVAYHEPGGLYLTIGSNKIFKVCDPSAQFFRTNPENCKMVLSMALAVRMSNKQITVLVDNAPGSDCASIPSWFGADVRFVNVVD